MNKKIAIITAGALALFAPAVIFLYPHNAATLQSAVISPSQVFTWDCEIPVQKPDAITFTCGDGNMYVEQIDWSTWNAQEAEGTGIYTANNCDPDCAEGTFVHAQVSVRLSNLADYKGKKYLRTLVIRRTDGENLPQLRESFYEWDVMEFAEMMGGN